MDSAVLIIMTFVFYTIIITTQQDLIDWDGNSICPRRVSRQVSQMVPYTETYRKIWRTRTRVNYRIEYHTEWLTKDACCSGYEEKNGECLPVCNGGANCPNGECIRPNECSCNIGFKLVQDITEQKCIPECSNCINGKCTAPKICTCNDGYEKSSTGSGECLPSCKPQCPNLSKCHENNNCICNTGYKLANVTIKFSVDSLDHYCEPICSPECDEHSLCVSPNYCICNFGYEKKIKNGIKSSYECMPSCNPPCDDHSSCTKPNFCDCHPGYAPINNQNNDTSTDISINQCVPVCIPSCGEFGKCQSPNSCICNPGYNLILDRDNKTSEIISVTCEPQCNPSCGIRGNCIAPPNKCSCEIGWKLKKNINEKKLINAYCQPHCESCPKFSICTKPNQCDCHQGYEKIIDNFNISCRPICDKKCINGICDTPNVCKCNNGFILDTIDPFNCEANCGFPGCFGGHCIVKDGKGICECNEGYHKTKIPHVCNPICQKCDNGTCISPDNCICNYGFIKNKTDHCSPTCDDKCFNGTCIAPFTCSCDSGFINSTIKNSTSMCLPFCESGCPNATCIGPNECLCLDGFVKNENGDCIPECYDLCNYGNLTVGICTAPNQCTCNPGYIFIDNIEGKQCQPYCKNSCINGICYLPEICKCNDGYILDILNSSLCNPICDDDCGHGDCIGPNDCVCHDGFVQRNNTNSNNETGFCVNPCSHGCGYGKCNIDYQNCECFYGWTGEYCDKTELCGIIRTENDINIYQWISSKKNETNETNENLQTVQWQGPMCNEMCVLSDVNNTNRCFRLSTDEEQYDNTTSIICFIKAESTCNSVKLSSTNYATPGIAIGTVIFIIGIVGIIIATNFIIKQRRNIQDYKVNPPRSPSYPSGNLLEPLDFTDSLLESDENSYL